MMNDPRGPRQAEEIPDVGLCADCVHMRVVENVQGSRFYLCRKSFADPAFPRYPRLPVRECAGFDPAGRYPFRGRNR